MDTPQPAATLSGIESLSDPVRRRLYEYVASSDAPTGRDAAAAATGISRTLAAYHLDRLAEAGLLTTSYARQDGRNGPGAGRPAKLYRPAQEEIAISFPRRDYRLLADLLATAAGADDSGTVVAALAEAARDEGTAIARETGDLMRSLDAACYEPVVGADDDITLCNCPFHQVARHQTELVCTMNHALVQGVLTGANDDPERAELAPAPGRCCVIIHRGVESPTRA